MARLAALAPTARRVGLSATVAHPDALPIGLHHGSLDVAARRKVEAAMAAGKLRAVVATSSLDLGIDWGAVDQVIQVGAPKGVSRLLQRDGRANHRMDEASRALLAAADSDRLGALTRGRRMVWVLGNHDPEPATFLPGEHFPEFADGPLTFRHEAARGAVGEISGHFHPKARVPARAADISRPCFVADARRLLLPAFGAYTGGLDVRDPAIARLFPRGGRAFLLGRERLFSFPLRAA